MSRADGSLRAKKVGLVAAMFAALPFFAQTSVMAQTTPEAPFKLREIATAKSPVGMIVHPVSRVAYVIEKGGRLVTLGTPEETKLRTGARLKDTVLDVSDSVSDGGEQGLLGAAFDLKGEWLYIHVTNNNGDTEIRAYRWRNNQADPATKRLLLSANQPYSNHNGGQLVMTEDGVLWIGLGDGGSSGDPKRNAQNKKSLLGKILRIVPTPEALAAYKIPAGNLSSGAGRREIWAMGLRNPWQFSIDRPTATVWIADVGQSKYEEINAVSTTAQLPNFGWNKREGKHAYNKGTRPVGSIDPVHEYTHDDGCSITGGYVYRGTEVPALTNQYVFSDYCTSDVRSIPVSGDRTNASRWDVKSEDASAFGTDASGELYLFSLAGPILRFERAGV